MWRSALSHSSSGRRHSSITGRLRLLRWQRAVWRRDQVLFGPGSNAVRQRAVCLGRRQPLARNQISRPTRAQGLDRAGHRIRVQRIEPELRATKSLLGHHVRAAPWSDHLRVRWSDLPAVIVCREYHGRDSTAWGNVALLPHYKERGVAAGNLVNTGALNPANEVNWPAADSRVYGFVASGSAPVSWFGSLLRKLPGRDGVAVQAEPVF
jgi:hypothetical protein